MSGEKFSLKYALFKKKYIDNFNALIMIIFDLKMK